LALRERFGVIFRLIEEERERALRADRGVRGVRGDFGVTVDPSSTAGGGDFGLLRVIRRALTFFGVTLRFVVDFSRLRSSFSLVCFSK